jgi:hypothetical protein
LGALKTLLAVSEGSYQGFLYTKKELKILSESAAISFITRIVQISHPQVLEIRLAVLV